MITYDRSIRNTIHTALRSFCGPVGSARIRIGGDAPLCPGDAAALSQLNSSSSRRNPPAPGRKRRPARLAAALIVLAALIAPYRPAQAQDDAPPPISATSSAALYLPQMARNWHAWFTDAELDDAMRRAGYNPQVAGMHTVCYLDPSSVVPILVRYSSCEQYLIGDQPTEGTGHFIWYVRLGDGIVTGLEVGQ